MMVTGKFPLLSQSFLVGKAAALARSGARVTVMAMGRGESRHDFADLERDDRIRVQYLPPRDHSSRAIARMPLMTARAARRSTADLRRLVQILRDRHPRPGAFSKHLYRTLPFVGERPDVLHFEFAGKASELLALFDLLPCPKVVSCRGADVSVQPLADPRAAELLREVLAKADRVHCVSHEILGEATRYGLDPAKAFVNHPSIDPEFFRPGEPTTTREGPPVVLSVGRLHWKKGYEYALQAVRMLIDRGVDLRYRIIGEGPAEDCIRFA
ncbi:MAG: glycosyltransferase, partial [Isosphaeraceae bacterium]